MPPRPPLRDDAAFTVLFDSACPICRREIEWLKRRDDRGRLATIDIASDDFDPTPFGLRRDEVQAELHGFLPDGTLIRGLESVRRCWEAVGLGWAMRPTRWPGLRSLSELGYRAFARYRVPLGRLFGGRDAACDDGACAAPGADRSRRAG